MKALITSLAFLSLLLISSFKNYQVSGNFISTSTNKIIIETPATIAENQIATFTMEFQEFKKGKPSKNGSMKITYYLNEDQLAIKPEIEGKQNTIMIFDAKSGMMTTLVNENGEKTGVKMKMPEVDLDAESVGEFDFSVTPTNESKKILGYDCKKYLIESTDYSGHAWITEEVQLDLNKTFAFMKLQKSSNNNIPSFGDVNGFPLETITKSKKKDESYEMKVIDLKMDSVDKDVFNTAGYTITDMSNFMNMGGE